jgi:hypothetical protein
MKFIFSILETLLIYFKIILLKKDIVLGPYHGEFGFEVSMNASFANSIKRSFKNKLIVVSQLGNKGLYKNIDAFIPYNYNLAKAGYGYGNHKDSLILRKDFLNKHITYKNAVFIDLTRINIYLFKQFVNFRYSALGNSSVQSQSNHIAVHFRSVIKSGTDDRLNFKNINADKLVFELFSRGYIINVIGHPDFSYCPNSYCNDYRSNDITFALNAIHKCDK